MFDGWTGGCRVVDDKDRAGTNSLELFRLFASNPASGLRRRRGGYIGMRDRRARCRLSDVLSLVDGRDRRGGRGGIGREARFVLTCRRQRPSPLAARSVGRTSGIRLKRREREPVGTEEGVPVVLSQLVVRHGRAAETLLNWKGSSSADENRKARFGGRRTVARRAQDTHAPVHLLRKPYVARLSSNVLGQERRSGEGAVLVRDAVVGEVRNDVDGLWASDVSARSSSNEQSEAHLAKARPSPPSSTSCES